MEKIDFGVAVDKVYKTCVELSTQVNPRKDDVIIQAFNDMTHGVLITASVCFNNDPATLIYIRDLTNVKRRELKSYLDAL